MSSTDEDVDALWACAGLGNKHVRVISEALGNEVINIIVADPDLAVLVMRAFVHAPITRLIIDEPAHTVAVLVPDDAITLAKGEHNEHVDLASALLGWTIEVRGDEGEGPTYAIVVP